MVKTDLVYYDKTSTAHKKYIRAMVSLAYKCSAKEILLCRKWDSLKENGEVRYPITESIPEMHKIDEN